VDVCGDEAWTMSDDLGGGFVEQVDQLLLAVRLYGEHVDQGGKVLVRADGCGHELLLTSVLVWGAGQQVVRLQKRQWSA
jgi:hypothetical protein